MEQGDFPSRAWPDMCAAYREPALAQACLELQTGFAVDVPLALVLALADRGGYGIAPASIPALVADAAAWRDIVIVPLRQTRQAMKSAFTSEPEKALREAIKQLELRAEQQHVRRIVDALPPATAQTGAARHYLAACGLSEQAVTDFLATFAVACDAQLEKSPA